MTTGLSIADVGACLGPGTAEWGRFVGGDPGIVLRKGQ